MGYNLAIGEAQLMDYPEDSYVCVEVLEEKHEKAPHFGEPTDFKNERWPSYSSWSYAMDFLELYEFSDEDSELCLIQEHPGFIRLNSKHKDYINKKKADYLAKYPNYIAGYCKCDGHEKDHPFDRCPECDDYPKENTQATRLEWLHYWINWAVDNCKTPIFSNG